MKARSWLRSFRIDIRIARRENRAAWWEQLAQDVVFAWRGIRGAPLLACVTVLTIALGVGATTAVFTVADTLILRPIAYLHAARVFVLRRESPTPDGFPPGPIPAQSLEAWRQDAQSIERALAFQPSGSRLLVNGGDTTTVRVAYVERGFLAFAGVHPLAGRDFTSEEVTSDGPRAVVLGEGIWRREFGASSDVIGRTVRINSRLCTIVGVVPASFTLPDFRSERPDLWLPLSLSSQDFMVSTVAVRLKPGVSREAASDEAAAYLKPSELDAPWNRDIRWRVRLSRPDESLKFREALKLLTAAVALLLLVACANVAHLFLARGAARERELAVRRALGAGRGRLLRHLVTESVLLASVGGGIAAAVAWASLRLLAAARPASLVALTYPSADARLVAFASLAAITVGLAVGVIAALRIAGRDVAQSLRAATAMHPAAARFRKWIVVGEVGLSTTLLVGALLLIHAVFGLERTRLGFDVRDLYTVMFQARQGETPESRAAFAAALRQAAEPLATPGDFAVTVTGFTWLSSRFDTPEHPASTETPGASVSFVGPDYFAMMGMPLLAGRSFDAGAAAASDVVISSTLARAVWPDANPIGRRFRNSRTRVMTGAMEPWRTVIGVVPDAVSNLLQTSGTSAIYQPLDWRSADGNVTLAIRLHGPDAMTRLGRLAAAVRPEPPRGVTTRIENVRRSIDQSAAEPRFTMRVLVTLAALGVVMAAVGLFGVVSYGVRQRTREIGVRMALGATRSGIARLVVGEGVRLTVGGIVLGSLGALATSWLLQGMLYGVSRVDPFAFGAGAAVLLVVTVVSCVVPVMRATRIDPLVATRSE